MSFGDRLRAWLRGESGSSTRAPRSGRSPRGRSSATTGAHVAELEEFVRTRHGVEVYLEPRTRLYGSSVLLVADDGEYLRREVADASFARAFCSRMGVPCYDAARTGYPKRVRDYDRGVRPQRIGLEDLPPWPDAGAAGDADRDTDGGADGGGDDPDALTDEEPPPPPV